MGKLTASPHFSIVNKSGSSNQNTGSRFYDWDETKKMVCKCSSIRDAEKLHNKAEAS